MKRVLSLGMLASACASWSQPAVRIDLLPEVQVQGEQVLLGEVAHLQSGELPVMQQLVQLPLGPAPRAGEAAVVRRAVLMDWLRRRTGIDAARLEWTGADATRVVRASQRVAGERIADSAAAAVRTWLVERGSPGDVQVRRPPRAVDVPAGDLRLQARRTDATLARAHLQVWVDLLVAGRVVRSVPVMVETGIAPVGPLIAATGAEPALAVSRGDWASLHTSAGAVSLESRVEVLQDGRIGDKVRVRTRGATALVLARIVAPGQLELAP